MERLLTRIIAKRKEIFTKREIFGWIIAFLLGRAMLFDCVSPFGPAFVAAYSFLNKDRNLRPLITTAFAMVGTFAANADISFIKYVLTYVIFAFIYTVTLMINERAGTFSAAFTSALSMLGGGGIYLWLTGQGTYDIIMLVFEASACFISVFIILDSMPVIYSGSQDSKLQADSLFCFYLVAAVAILGFTDLDVGNLNVGNILSALYIMIIAISGGAATGAAGGIGVGLISSFAFFPITDIIGVYGTCGMAAGLMRRYRRIGVVTGFILSDIVLNFYFAGFGGSIFTITESLIAVVLFMLMPKSLITETEALITNTNVKNRTAQRAVDVLTDKLNNLSQSFLQLGKNFSQFVMPKKEDILSDMTIIFDKCTEKVCKKCGLRYTCWDREFKSTYRSLLSLAPVLYEKGRIEGNDKKGKFSEKCIKSGEMVNELNEMYSQYKIDRMWCEQIQEGRELAVNQLYGISRVMENTAKGMERQLVFDTHVENCIDLELEKRGIKCSDVTVVKNLTGRFDVTLKIRSCKGKDTCKEIIVPAVSQVLGVAMELVTTCSNTPSSFGRCVVKLCEKEKISVLCAGVKRCKNGEKECGDNFGCNEIPDGKYTIVLSDGMGSGKHAADVSNAVVQLMNGFLDVGFDKKLSARLVSNALFLKPGEECSVTVDAAVFDLFSSTCDFLKIGASPSYIRRGDTVSKVSKSTMPMGILKEIDTAVIGTELKPNDIVVMVSDGLSDSGDEWLTKHIASSGHTNPKMFADSIMEEAVKRKSNIIDDDMTVVVALITER